MLRITSGTFGGRKIEQPKTTKTRPVTEQTRHAIFQVLGDVSGLTVLDLYAGSGALGLESLSLGAASATFVDSARVAIDIIKVNCKTLEIVNQAAIVNSKVEQFTKTSDAKFDLIFFDPPYTLFDEKTLKQSTELVTPQGIVIVSCSVKTPLPTELGKVELIKTKTYGDTQIAYYSLKN